MALTDVEQEFLASEIGALEQQESYPQSLPPIAEECSKAPGTAFSGSKRCSADGSSMSASRAAHGGVLHLHAPPAAASGDVKGEWHSLQRRAWGLTEPRGSGSDAVAHMKGAAARGPMQACPEARTPPAAAGPMSASCLAQLAAVGRLELQLAHSLEHAAGARAGLVPEPPSVAGAASALCRQYNRAAMRLVEAGHARDALALLEKAQVLCEPGGVLSAHEPLRASLLAVTLNNLGVHRQRTGDAQGALRALRHAADLEAELLRVAQQPTPANRPPTDPNQPGCNGNGVQGACSAGMDGGGEAAVLDTPASTQLNLCTVLSGTGRHAEALECARAALRALCTVTPLGGAAEGDVVAWACAARGLRPAGNGGGGGSWASSRQSVDGRGTAGGAGEEGRGAVGTGADGEGAGPEARGSEGSEGSAGGVGKRLARMPPMAQSVLSMCLYNKAVQLEHLGHDGEAMRYYCAAAGLASKLFGRGSELSRIFSKSLQAFKTKLSRLRPHACQCARSASSHCPASTTPPCLTASSARHAGRPAISCHAGGAAPPRSLAPHAAAPSALLSRQPAAAMQPKLSDGMLASGGGISSSGKPSSSQGGSSSNEGLGAPSIPPFGAYSPSVVPKPWERRPCSAQPALDEAPGSTAVTASGAGLEAVAAAQGEAGGAAMVMRGRWRQRSAGATAVGTPLPPPPFSAHQLVAPSPPRPLQLGSGLPGPGQRLQQQVDQEQRRAMALLVAASQMETRGSELGPSGGNTRSSGGGGGGGGAALRPAIVAPLAAGTRQRAVTTAGAGADADALSMGAATGRAGHSGGGGGAEQAAVARGVLSSTTRVGAKELPPPLSALVQSVHKTLAELEHLMASQVQSLVVLRGVLSKSSELAVVPPAPAPAPAHASGAAGKLIPVAASGRGRCHCQSCTAMSS